MLFNRLRTLQLQTNGDASHSPFRAGGGLDGDPLNPSQAHMLQVLQTENTSLRVRRRVTRTS